MPLSAFIQKCRAANDEASLFKAFRAFADRYDADIVVYNLLIENLRHLGMPEASIYYDVPQAWTDRYRAKNYFKIDPVMHAAMKAHEAFHWYECGKIIPLTAEQQKYLIDMRACGVVDGLAIPIRAELGSAAFFAIGSSKHTFEITPEGKCELWCACLYAHNRCMELRGKYSSRDVGLSRREREVLTLVAQGKSNTTIAKNLGVSDHTIDTLVRRCFVKLGVSDRLSAALKAVGAGVVQI